MIKDIYRLFITRRHRKRDTKLNRGKCPWCGSRVGCRPWCWGPKLHSFIWQIIKNLHRPKMVKLIARAYKTELESVGVEPWHRY